VEVRKWTDVKLKVFRDTFAVSGRCHQSNSYKRHDALCTRCLAAPDAFQSMEALTVDHVFKILFAA